MATINPEDLFREDLSDFPPYSMGHVPLADLGSFIKLDLNENCYGPSPRALQALAEMKHYHRYVGQEELNEAIARYVGVDVSHIVTSNGADEMIDLVQRIFVNHGDTIIDCPPSFEMYSFFARMNGALIESIPRREDFGIDIDAIEERCNSAGHVKLIFLASPSNPDGGMLSSSEVEQLLKLPVIVVIDEAYAEFAGETLAKHVPTQPNLIILRTFSKWAGLASLRMGYCIAPPAVAAKILQCKSPENVNAAANVAAHASLEDIDYLMANVRSIVADRERLSAELSKLGFLHPLPSRANFILCRVDGRDGKHISDGLAERGILIRSFGSARLRNYIRIAVGKPEENDAVLRALESFD